MEKTETEQAQMRTSWRTERVSTYPAELEKARRKFIRSYKGSEDAAEVWREMEISSKLVLHNAGFASGAQLRSIAAKYGTFTQRGGEQ